MPRLHYAHVTDFRLQFCVERKVCRKNGIAFASKRVRLLRCDEVSAIVCVCVYLRGEPKHNLQAHSLVIVCVQPFVQPIHRQQWNKRKGEAVSQHHINCGTVNGIHTHAHTHALRAEVAMVFAVRPLYCSRLCIRFAFDSTIAMTNSQSDFLFGEYRVLRDCDQSMITIFSNDRSDQSTFPESQCTQFT